jgi:hypothetical protein
LSTLLIVLVLVSNALLVQMWAHTTRRLLRTGEVLEWDETKRAFAERHYILLTDFFLVASLNEKKKLCYVRALPLATANVNSTVSEACATHVKNAKLVC